MNQPIWFVFIAGMAVEVIWLWDDAHPEAGHLEAFRLAGRTLRKAQWLMIGLGVAALLLAGLAFLLGLGDRVVGLENPILFAFFTAFGLFIFGAGVVADDLLPRVNEKSILSMQAIIAIGLLVTQTSFNPWAFLFLLVLPMLVTAALVVKQTPLNDIAKAIVYFWYLFSLVMLTYQNGSAFVLNQSNYNLVEGFLAGAIFVFLLLHMLFSIRFFLIASSLILPANRPLVGHIMPRLFGDEQISPQRFALLLVVILAVIGLNAWLQVLPMMWLINLAVILSAQLLFRSDNRMQG